MFYKWISEDYFCTHVYIYLDEQITVMMQFTKMYIPQ